MKYSTGEVAYFQRETDNELITLKGGASTQIFIRNLKEKSHVNIIARNVVACSDSYLENVEIAIKKILENVPSIKMMQNDNNLMCGKGFAFYYVARVIKQEPLKNMLLEQNGNVGL